MEEERVETAWRELTQPLDGGVAEKWMAVVQRMYGERRRHYHTLAHVADLLALRDTHARDVSDDAAVTYAIVFHDIVYEPRARDNEERSADLFQAFSSEANLSMINEALPGKVVSYILATKTHIATVNGLQSDDNDLGLFLDFDMAVLGRPWPDYKLYTEQIRQEYAHLSNRAFATGRSKILQSFLDMPYIYATDSFRKTHEQQARENIAKELEVLSHHGDT